MRYFAHDGTAARGPLSPRELLAQPWFDGDTLVCPAGSRDSEDWKPALSYPALRQALLAASSPEDLAPAAAAPAGPAPPRSPTALLALTALGAALAGAAAAAFSCHLLWKKPAIPPPAPVPTPHAASPSIAPVAPPSAPVPPPPAPSQPARAAAPPPKKAAAKARARRPPETKPAPRPARAAAPAAAPVAAPPAAASPSGVPAGLPGIPPRPGVPAAPSSPAAPAGAAPGEADIALAQAVEQFEFCAQLIAQSAFADHHDSCLCSGARGDRDSYAAALKAEEAAGTLEMRAQVLSARMEGGQARIRARWSRLLGDAGREIEEAWAAENGQWCRR